MTLSKPLKQQYAENRWLDVSTGFYESELDIPFLFLVFLLIGGTTVDGFTTPVQ